MIDWVIQLFYKSQWSAIFIYGIFGVASLFLAWMRFRWWRYVQREFSVLIFAITNLFQGIAFSGAALITAPHPIADFRFLLPWVRLAWLCTLICFLIGTYLFYSKLEEILRIRRQV